ncbi:MAG: fluoride efflux transporter CrcB [Ectothiorhodospiraceae bacterium]|nr:fluoride efflux transporter CrcB [Ectothiorhodospiraceae bacterium]MCH8505173.1 fluoride efflux transporter CrcB [Ectothiorhodospiraceae bacterium]
MSWEWKIGLWVALGSAIGGMLRLAVSHVHLSHGDISGFPWATLTVNIAGSLLIGYFARHTRGDGLLPSGERFRQFLMAGICGGFTTFSLFSLETALLLQAGHFPMAAIYVLGTLVGGVAAAAAGWSLANRMIARGNVSA